MQASIQERIRNERGEEIKGEKEEKKVTAEERREGRTASSEAVKKEMSNTTVFIKHKTERMNPR